GRANPVEHALHPGKAAKPNVGRRKGKHHHKRRQNEGNGDQSCASDSEVNVSQVDRKLRRKRARSQLGKRKPLQVILLANPSATTNQILLHVARKRNRSTKSYGAEPQEIPDETRQRDALLLSVRQRCRSRHFAEFVCSTSPTIHLHTLNTSPFPTQ